MALREIDRARRFLYMEVARMTTLFVDDQLGRIRRLRARLAEIDDVIVATTLAEARSALASKRQIDAHIVDMNLGSDAPFGGVGVLLEAQKRHPGAVVVVYTARDLPEFRLVARMCGASFIVKPIDEIERLCALVSEIATGTFREDDVLMGGETAFREAVQLAARQYALERKLTEREAEVLLAYAELRDTEQVLTHLAPMSKRTLDTHVASILGKAKMPRIAYVANVILRRAGGTLADLLARRSR
jgi:DNA-binding NarL/FixJ family response regulator